jgi:hypothetical protein
MDGLYLIIYFAIMDIIRTLTSPFFIIIFLIILYQYYKLSKSENCISINKFSPFLSALNSAFYGAIGGVISTVAFIYLEVVVIPRDFMYIIIIAIILSFINTRFMCIAYGGSILSLLSILFGLPVGDTRDIMLIVSTLHIVESFLILLNGYKGKFAAFFEQRGQYVGGYNINRFWPLPFVIFVGDGLIRPVTLMAILSYGDFTLTFPRRKIIATSLILLLYSSILMILIKLNLPSIFSPIFALVGHEVIIHLNRLREESRLPIFTNPNKGVRVIDVSKNGIANDVGITIGDIVLSVNEASIYSYKDLEELERLSIETWRINYFSRKKGLRTEIYSGNKKSLGISVVPRELY